MAASNSHLSYDDLRVALDRALDSDKGIRIHETTLGRLIHLRQRIHKLKSLERERSRKVFKPEDPRYGTTPYDKLAIQTNEVALRVRVGSPEAEALSRDELFIEVIRRTADALDFEEII